MSNVLYASAVELNICQVLYMARDLFCDCLVNHYQSNPGPTHDWQAVKRIFATYVVQVTWTFCYHNGDLKLREYSDTNWGCDLKGYLFTIGGGSHILV